MGTMKGMGQGTSEAVVREATLYHHWEDGSRTVGSLLARRGIQDRLYQYAVVISVLMCEERSFNKDLVNGWVQHSRIFELNNEFLMLT